jgi:hypothetical protein
MLKDFLSDLPHADPQAADMLLMPKDPDPQATGAAASAMPLPSGGAAGKQEGSPLDLDLWQDDSFRIAYYKVGGDA